MSANNETFNPFDPTGMFKSMRKTSMDAWSKMMIQIVNTDAYAQSVGQLLDVWLTTSTPFRKALDASMAQALAKLNLPSRTDITSLAERLTNIEMRLDDLDARLEASLRAPRKTAGTKGRPANGENQP